LYTRRGPAQIAEREDQRGPDQGVQAVHTAQSKEWMAASSLRGGRCNALRLALSPCGHPNPSLLCRGMRCASRLAIHQCHQCTTPSLHTRALDSGDTWRPGSRSETSSRSYVLQWYRCEQNKPLQATYKTDSSPQLARWPAPTSVSTQAPSPPTPVLPPIPLRRSRARQPPPQTERLEGRPPLRMAHTLPAFICFVPVRHRGRPATRRCSGRALLSPKQAAVY
jgi:hypothetical protein